MLLFIFGLCLAVTQDKVRVNGFDPPGENSTAEMKESELEARPKGGL